MQIETINAIALLGANVSVGPVKRVGGSAPGSSGGSLGLLPKEDAEAAPTQEALARALRPLAEAVEAFNISLKFSRDEATGTIVVEMIDQKSGKALRQFPNEVQLHLAATLGKLRGRIFDRQA